MVNFPAKQPIYKIQCSGGHGCRSAESRDAESGQDYVIEGRCAGCGALEECVPDCTGKADSIWSCHRLFCPVSKAMWISLPHEHRARRYYTYLTIVNGFTINSNGVQENGMILLRLASALHPQV